MDEGRTVTLKELLLYVLLKWRMILFFMIIFGAIAGSVGAFKAYRDASSAKEQEMNIDFSQYESELTENEIREVKNAVDDYVSYNDTYNSYKIYNESSIRMQLDANAVPTEKKVYRISGNSDIINIIDGYVEMIPNDNICEKIFSTINWDLEEVKTSYIAELISVKNSHMNAMITGGEISNIIGENSGEDNSGLMTIQIIADNEENCRKIGEIIEEELSQITVGMGKQFGEFSINKIGDNYCEEANSELLIEQKNSMTEMNNVGVLMKNLKSSLSEQQQNYFTALLNETMTQLESDEGASTELEVEEEINIDYFNIKYIIVGMMAGAFLICFYSVCKFLLNKHLVSVSYIRDDLKCPVIGVFSSERDKKKIGDKLDRWIISLFRNNSESDDNKEKVDMACTVIQMAAQKNDLEKICIVSTMKNARTLNYMENIKENLEARNLDIKLIDNILYDAEALKDFVASDGVVFVEEIGKSSVQEIYQETQYCDEYAVYNLGFVIAGNIN